MKTHFEVLQWLTIGALIWPLAGFSENPFGVGNSGEPSSGPTSEPRAAEDEDDVVDPGNSFGFTPPPTNGMNTFPGSPSDPNNAPPPIQPAPTPAPPPSADNKNGFSAAPPSAIPRAAPPGRIARPTSPAPVSPGSGKPLTKTSTETQKKSAPKLADYLELDPAVKGLEVKNFDLPDKEIKDVVTLISKWTGKNFILDSKVRGKITIMGPSQVTLQEAYQAFLSALEANGLTTVKAGKFIRVIESAEARRAPVETFAGDYAPNTDQFITRIFQLKYINADEVQREFRDMTSRQGKLFAYEPTNSIIITDTGSNIKRIQEILNTLDVKGFETSLHVLRIKNSSSKQIAEMLGEIYGDEKGGKSSGPRTFRRSALERTRGGGIISKVIPDEQTNSLIVLANASGFDQLLKIVSRLDVKVNNTGKIHVYYCEYSKAEDLAQTLASLTGGGGGGAKSSARRSPTTPSGPGGNSATGGPSVSTSGSVSAELDGGVRVTADAATNSLVIVANAGDYQTLKRVLRKLDIPRLQVFVETAILELNMDHSNSWGVNYGASDAGRPFVGGFIGDVNTLTSYLTRGAPPSGFSVPIVAGERFNQTSSIGGQNQSLTTFSFQGFLRMITTDSNASVLSTPQIIALDNEKAVFKVQDEIPTQSNFTPVQGAVGVPGAVTGSIERTKVGIEIQLTPHINAASRNIRLEIEQKVDSINNTVVPQGLSQVTVGTTSRTTNTAVVVRDQDFVVLGGLMSDRVTEDVQKVPLLGDIPILGWLFKSRIKKSTKTNLVILLRPKIISTSLASAELADDRLKKRKQFIEDHMGGKEHHEEGVQEIEKQVTEQKSRESEDVFSRYRNNEEESNEDPQPEPEVEKPPKKKKIQPSPPPSQLGPESRSAIEEAETRERSASAPETPSVMADPAADTSFDLPPSQPETSTEVSP